MHLHLLCLFIFVIWLFPLSAGFQPVATAMIERLLNQVFSPPIVDKGLELGDTLADLEWRDVSVNSIVTE